MQSLLIPFTAALDFLITTAQFLIRQTIERMGWCKLVLLFALMTSIDGSRDKKTACSFSHSLYFTLLDQNR